MKLLACADLHLGAGTAYGRQPHGPESRLADQEQVWLRVCDLAISEEVDGVIFAGDAFHRRKPTPGEILAFRAGLDRLCMHGIPVFAIDGNHDVTSPDLPSALSIFEGELELYRTPAVRYWPAIGIEQEVTIAFLPWTTTGRLVAELGHRTDTDAIHRDCADLLLHVARGLRAQCTEDRPAFLVAHWSVTGATTPTGASTDEFREPVLALGELEAMGWDAVILGHIHKHGVISQAGNGAIFYCGSPGVVDFGETATPHGVWILDTDLSEKSLIGHPIEDRRFVTIEADLLGVDDAGDVLAKYALAYPGGLEGAVVRVRYQATAEQAKRIDHAHVTRALYDAGAHHVYAIQPEIVREDRARVSGVDETLGPMKALDLWLEHQELSERVAVEGFTEALRARAARYIEEASA